jgi:ABC-type multidrug transport system fused ATPase/permease subunit
MTPKEGPRGQGPWRLLAWAAGGDRRSAGLLAATSVLVAGCEVTLPLFLAALIDEALGGRDLGTINLIGLGMLALVGVLYVVHVALLKSEARLVNGGTFRLRQLLYRRMLAQPIAWFGTQKSGELVHRVVADGEVLDSHGVYVLSEIPFALLTILGVLAAMTWLSWPLAIGVFVFLALSSLLAARLGRGIPTLRRSIQQIGAQLSHTLQESIGGVRALRTAGAESQRLAVLDGLNAEEMRLANQEAAIGARLEPVLELIEMLGVVVVVWGGAVLLAKGSLTAGALVAFIAYIELLSEPFGQLGKYLRGAQTCRGILERMDSFLAGLSPLPKPGTATLARPLTLAADGIGFRYPGAELAALKGVSFAVAPGEVVALVGANGAGKSTLADILLGLRSPSEGAACLGGVSIAAWEPGALRAAFAAMPQDATVFHASLAENLALGLDDSTQVAMLDAIAAAGLTPLLKRLPQGLETVVGDRGTRLSGGERQRLGLARLLLRRPAVALLDEPTAALDGKASREVSVALRRLATEGAAVLVIAHRPETVAGADRVVFLAQGEVEAIGRPDDLARTCPGFQALFPDVSPLALA